MMKIEFGAKSDIGNYRSSNQDYLDYAKNRFDNYIAIVCDGMGGHKHGEIASKLAVEYLLKYFMETNFNNLTDNEVNTWYYNVIKQVQQEMISYAMMNPDTNDMGTTVVSAIIANNRVYVLNIGDSRLYKLHNNKLYQITVDQNMYNSIDARERQEIEFQGQYKRHYNSYTFWKVLTSALGPTKNLKIDTYVIEDIYGTYLMSTDGIHDYLEEPDIIDVLTSANKLSDKVKILISRALENLSTDNLSGIVFEISEI